MQLPIDAAKCVAAVRLVPFTRAIALGIPT